MAILDDVKVTLRISNTAYDQEITDLINACKAELGLVGIMSQIILDTDMLIKRCIITYCKVNFGWNNPDAERFQESYDMILNHIALSRDYSFYTITFTIADISDDSVIREAKIKLWNAELNYEETKYTDESGQAIFYVRTENNFKYDVTADDFEDDLHDEDDKNIVDITENTSVAVEMTGV